MHRLLAIALPVCVLGLGAITAAPAPFNSRVGSASKAGLSLTVRLDRAVYRPADELKLAFELKNETNRDLYIGDSFFAPGYHEAGPGRHFEVHVTAKGRGPLYFWSRMLTSCTTSGIRKVFRLRPREVYSGSISLTAGPKQGEDRFAQRGGSFEDKGTRKAHVLGKDGRKYTVVVRYQVNPKSHGVWQPPAGFKDEQLWKGELNSSPIEFEVAEK